MEQILAFVLGVSVGVFVWTVVVAFRTASRVKNIEDTIQNIYQVLERNDEQLHRRIDQEIDRTDKLIGNLYSVIDSRFDKFEAKVTKEKQVIKG
jgi:dissimilatory sulfite reductase (desulfoviridin) alpha/beta subunit